MNGVQYIGNGEFVVTEEWLVEVFFTGSEHERC